MLYPFAVDGTYPTYTSWSLAAFILVYLCYYYKVTGPRSKILPSLPQPSRAIARIRTCQARKNTLIRRSECLIGNLQTLS